jgi:hypothetical protein
VRVAIQWGVFDALGDVGAEGKTSTQLAESAGADPKLVGKLAGIGSWTRHLSLPWTGLLHALLIEGH